MVKIENIAKEWAGGTVDIVLNADGYDYEEDWELSLSVKEGDKLELIEIYRLLEDDSVADKSSVYKRQEDLVKDLLLRTYKDSIGEEKISEIVVMRSLEIALELMFKFKLKDRKAFEAIAQAKDSKIKEIMEGDQPQKEIPISQD